MSEKIFKTDRQFRTKLLTAYGIGAGLILLAIVFALPPFLKYLRASDLPTFLNVTEICVIVFLLVFIGPAIYLIGIGKKIMRHRQTPYPGMKVIRDTKVVFGNKAVFRGKILIFLGVLSIFLSIAGSLASHYYFEKFRHFHPFTSPVRLAQNFPM